MKKIGYKNVNFPDCHQMSVKTVEKRRKRSWPLYLMLCKGRYKTWITSSETLFHLSFTTGKMKIQCKDLLPAPGNRLNETHDIERRIWQRQRREGRNEGEKESGGEKKVVGKRRYGWTMYCNLVSS
ncbi:hypothetical protein TNCV_3394681 [Trichonephila clavipes]|nr:hypothetical protein TNCV_3394681 [Trichonephila clavipes]